MKLYAAYGSNMNISQMRRRCPDAELIGTSTLDGYVLEFRGNRYGAHATVRKANADEADAAVPLVLWKISDADEKRLDRYEGYPTYYIKRYLIINVNGAKKRVMLYIMNGKRELGVPTDDYFHTIEKGYLENKLDTDYLYNHVPTITTK